MLYASSVLIHLLYKLSSSFSPILKSIAFVCSSSSSNDGLSVDEIAGYTKYAGDIHEKRFISFCIQFSVENNWLSKTHVADRFSLTALGRQFVSSQFS
jgi:hypothetical protein